MERAELYRRDAEVAEKKFNLREASGEQPEAAFCTVPGANWKS
jgi:hypothetical protein